MPIFEVEQYEIHTVTYCVDAIDAAAAIKAVLDGDTTETINDSQVFVETAEDCGMPADRHHDIVEGLEALGVTVDEFIPSIRSVTLIAEDPHGTTKDANPS